MESSMRCMEAGYLIKEVQHQIRKRMDAALLALDLTTPQYAALTRLQESPGLSNAALAVRCFVTPQTMHLIVQNLAERKLVTRTPSPTHGKILNIVITPSGAEILAQADGLIVVVETEIFGRLAPRELTTLIDTLKTVRQGG